MATKIKIGVIGSGGRILKGVLRMLFQATDQAEVVALFDPSTDSIRAAKEMYNPNAKVYDDYKELVRNPELDWILIGSLNCFHAEQAIAAFKAGKHVYCEKPLATTMEDCLAMRDAYRKSGRMFSFGFTLRYSPFYRKLNELITSGAIGRIVSMEFNETLHFGHGAMIAVDWRNKTRNSGGHLLEKCCHDVDLVNWMVNSLPVRAASFGGRNIFVSDNQHLYERLVRNVQEVESLGKTRTQWLSLLKERNPFTSDGDIVDNQVVIFEYANGARASFHTNCSTAIPERRMYICGTEGTIRANSRSSTLECSSTSLRNGLDDCEVKNDFLMNGQDMHGHAGGDLILGKELAAAMLQGKASSGTLDDGLRSSISIFGADESMKTGRMVDIRPYWEKAGIALPSGPDL